MHVFPGAFFIILEAVWPFWKETVLLAFCLKSFDCGAVTLSVSFFPFGVLDGRFYEIISIPDHYLFLFPLLIA